MIKIPLQGSKLITIVDDDTPADIVKMKWRAHYRRGVPYASLCLFVRGNPRSPKSERKQKRLYLHKLILPGCVMVDHKSGDTLDNRKENLRPATRQQNFRNTVKRKKSARSKYRGVYRLPLSHPDSGAPRPWRAGYGLNGKWIYLGSFATEEEAARVHDDEARKHFGEFGRFNFPRPRELSAIK